MPSLSDLLERESRTVDLEPEGFERLIRRRDRKRRTGPVLRNPGTPIPVGFRGLPPEGATPSKPLRGELVMEDSDSNPVHWTPSPSSPTVG